MNKVNKHVVKTYEQLVKDFQFRVTFGYPTAVAVPCKKCGQKHPGFYQYRYGQHILYLETDNGYLIPQGHVVGCIREYEVEG